MPSYPKQQIRHIILIYEMDFQFIWKIHSSVKYVNQLSINLPMGWWYFIHEDFVPETSIYGMDN